MIVIISGLVKFYSLAFVIECNIRSSSIESKCLDEARQNEILLRLGTKFGFRVDYVLFNFELEETSLRGLFPAIIDLPFCGEYIVELPFKSGIFALMGRFIDIHIY